MCRRERDVSGRVPVLRQNDILERLRNGVDQRHDLVTLLNGEAPAGHEAVLHIYDDEGVIRTGLDLGLREDRWGEVAAENAAAAERNERRV